MSDKKIKEVADGPNAGVGFMNQTLLHIGIEVVVVGGITYYLTRRIGQLEEKVSRLEDIIKNYQTTFQQFDTVIRAHQDIISRIPPQFLIPPQQQSQTHQQQSQPHHQSSDFPMPPNRSFVPSQTGSVDLSPDDFDAMLRDELSDIQSSRETELVDETPNVLCKDGVCELIDSEE